MKTLYRLSCKSKQIQFKLNIKCKKKTLMKNTSTKKVQTKFMYLKISWKRNIDQSEEESNSGNPLEIQRKYLLTVKCVRKLFAVRKF